ncbi:MAG: putative peptidoglycan glycosyltransferase FtsW [Paracoccaceae bacterium]
MTEMAFGRAPAAPGESALLRWWRTVDRWTLGAVLALVALGLVIGMAASAPLAERNGLGPFHYVIRQAGFALVALGLMVFVSMQDVRTVRRLAVLGFCGALVAAMLLPVFGTDFGKGAVRWYSLGFASLQPSEFLKPAFVGTAAWMMAASAERHGPPGITLSFLLATGCAALLAMQPDFGQAALLMATWGAMFFVAGAPAGLLVGLGAAVAGVGAFAYENSQHFARRIDGFLAAEIDPRTQLGYATNAIREGGFLGVGLGEGSVKNTLPDAHTDFVIAVAAEEYGLLLCLGIIALYLLITVRALLRLAEERDALARLAGSGMAALMGLQAFVNLGVAIRLLPAKGMTLPFVSYGGSSLMAAGIGMGLLLAMTRRRPQRDVLEAFEDGAGR